MNPLYNQLPAIDRLLRQAEFGDLIARFGRQQVTAILRQQQQDARDTLAGDQRLPAWHPAWHQEAQRRLEQRQRNALRPVINLSGTVLHTNLGRAQLAEAAIAAAVSAMRQPVTLEYDLDGAGRSHRDRALAARLCQLTGAEDACIVNNNAAAVLLMLAALAAGREVIVSRGELVEIGGAFRVPDVMRQAGCQLVEVGTTNRTHLRDYQQAIGEQTALLMKVHTSNYQIAGFTHAVAEAELAQLAREQGVPLVSDLGSGSLIDLSAWDLPPEPMPQQLIAAGVDLVSFSGDKLLGGPQAGIIVGKRELIARLQQHPLKRALRADKVTLAALDATLMLYQQPESLAEQLPTLRKLVRPQAEIAAQADRLLAAIGQHFAADWLVAVEPCLSQIGSGSLPVDRLPGYALTFTPRTAGEKGLNALADALRQRDIPIIGRLQQGKLWLDLRCLDDETAFLESLLS